MLIQNPTHNPEQIIETLANTEGLTIACYCAQWCDTCGGYKHDLSQLSEQYPQHCFLWIDIEDDPDLLDDFDVENFPTLLIQKDEKNYFFGTMLPHISHLERLIQRIQADDRSVEGPANLAELLAKM